MSLKTRVLVNLGRQWAVERYMEVGSSRISVAWHMVAAVHCPYTQQKKKSDKLV